MFYCLRKIPDLSEFRIDRENDKIYLNAVDGLTAEIDYSLKEDR